MAILNSQDLVEFSIELLADTRTWIGAHQAGGKWRWMNGQEVNHPEKYGTYFNDWGSTSCATIKDGKLLDIGCQDSEKIETYFCEFKRSCLILN